MDWQKVSNSTAPSPASSVGIWWFWKHAVFYADTTPVASGIRYGDCIIGASDHAETWDRLRGAGRLAALPAELQEEYFSIPRGRVVFHCDTGRFTVLHGGLRKRQLLTVCKAFGLSLSITDFDIDFHYQNHDTLIF